MPNIVYKYGNVYISNIPTLEWVQLIKVFGSDENLSDEGRLCTINYEEMCYWLNNYQEESGLLHLREFFVDVKVHMDNENYDEDIYFSKDVYNM